MRRTVARVLLALVIHPLDWLSWWCEARLGAFHRAYNNARLADIFGVTAEPESTDLPWLPRSLQWVLTAAQPGTSSGCPERDGEPR